MVEFSALNINIAIVKKSHAIGKKSFLTTSGSWRFPDGMLVDHTLLAREGLLRLLKLMPIDAAKKWMQLITANAFKMLGTARKNKIIEQRNRKKV